MRTTPEECAELGRRIARTLNNAKGPITLFMPLRGLSLIDTESRIFHDPVGRKPTRVLALHSPAGLEKALKEQPDFREIRPVNYLDGSGPSGLRVTDNIGTCREGER